MLAPATRHYVFALLFVAATLVGLTAFQYPKNKTIDFPVAEGETISILKGQPLSDFASILRQSREAGQFVPYDPQAPRSSYDQYVNCWIQLPLRNQSSEALNGALEVDYRWVDVADLYEEQADGSYRRYRNGESVPFAQKSLAAHTHAFPIRLEARESKRYFVYLRDYYWLTPALTLWKSQTDYLEQAQSEQRTVFLYMGLLAGLVIMNACVYLAFRDRDTLAYLLFLISANLLHIVHFNLHIPLLARHLRPELSLLPAGVNFLLYSGLLILSAGLFMRFALEFLQIKTLSSRLHRVVSFIANALILISPVFMFGLGDAVGHSTNSVVAAIWAASQLLALSLGIYCAFRKTPQAYFFIPAILMLILVSWQYTSTLLAGGFPNSELLMEWLYASAIEMIVLAVGISERFRMVAQQKQAAQKRALKEAERRTQLQSQYNQQLEQEVANRTRELAATSKQKGELLRIIAHDIKSPIDGVNSLARMLSQSPDQVSSEKVKEYTKDIQASAAQLSELTKSLLLWGQLQTGQHPIAPQPYLLHDLQEAIAPSLEMLARKKQLDLQWRIEGKRFALFDFESIASVLRNLVSNAIKYSHPNYAIEIGSTPCGNDIEIYVRDCGTGIDERTLQRIRERQPVESAKGVEGEPGTGIGLQICHGILDAHETFLKIESAPGKGTRCSFTLPSWSESV